MSTFLKSTLGILVLSAAMVAGLGQANEAQARPWGGYYGGARYGSYYTPYRYNNYRPYYNSYNYGNGYRYNNYYTPYGYQYNNYYSPYSYGGRGYINLGGVGIGW